MRAPRESEENNVAPNLHRWIEQERDRIIRENAIRRALVLSGLAILAVIVGIAVYLAYTESRSPMPDDQSVPERVVAGDSRSG